MAHKVERKQDASAGQDPALEAVAALVPDIKTTIAGRALVFREYAVFEGYEVAHIARHFIAALYAEAKTGELKYSVVRRLIGPHKDAVVAIAARSADVDESWVLALERDDAEQFFASWFVANASFFVREVLVDLQQERAEKAMASKSTGSSSGFPLPDLEISTDSAGAPSVN